MSRSSENIHYPNTQQLEAVDGHTPLISHAETLYISPRIINKYLVSWPAQKATTYHNDKGEICHEEEAESSTTVLLQDESLVAIIDYQCSMPQFVSVELYGETLEELQENWKIFKKHIQILEDDDEFNLKPSKDWLAKMKKHGMPVYFETSFTKEPTYTM